MWERKPSSVAVGRGWTLLRRLNSGYPIMEQTSRGRALVDGRGATRVAQAIHTRALPPERSVA